MLRIFKTNYFSRWAHKHTIDDASLKKAVSEIRNGLLDARLGGHVVKKRIPLPGKGKRSGARLILATNLENRYFFIFGFEKSQRENITLQELTTLKKLAKDLLSLSESKLNTAVIKGTLLEIENETYPV